MSYTFYSFRDREDQDEGMWADQTLPQLIESSRNRTLHGIFEKYMDRKPLKILEAGCGMGIWIHYLREKGHDIIGIDYLQSTVDKVKKADPTLPVQQGDVNETRQIQHGTTTLGFSLVLAWVPEKGSQVCRIQGLGRPRP